MKTLLLFFSAITLFVLGAVIGVITAMLCTPLLWKLEKPTGLELAGHSGPVDGVIFFFALIFGAAFAGVFLLRRLKKERS